MAVSEIICQVGIFLFGGLSIYCVSCTGKLHRWAFIFGALSTPFFFYTTIKHAQVGMLLLNFWYLVMWLRGVYNYWIVPWRNKATNP